MICPTVIVPVFNAFEHLETCLDSLARTLPHTANVILIDDASTDARVKPFLRAWVSEAKSQRRLLEHDRNRGFVVTANHGMQMADTDVVLLNSDTEVTVGWYESISTCLGSDTAIATATPWSNNGEIVSIPGFCQANEPPADADGVAASITACGSPEYPELPTAVGFCMAISFLATQRLGYFDELTFGLGYGEENDFCLRAEQAGLRNVLCDDAYVVHHGGASFGPLGIRPDEKSMQRLLAKHPDYLDKVSEFIRRDPLAPRRQRIIQCLERDGLVAGWN